MVRVAIRHGIRAQEGLIVPAGPMVQLQQPARIAEAHADAAAAQEKHEDVNGAFLERLMPGWRESQRDLNERVNESVANSIRDAVEIAREQIERHAPDAGLADWWRRLGGVTPDPL